MEPAFASPRYVAFALTEQVSFAVWSGKNDDAVPETPRTSEVGLMVPGSGREVDGMHRQWASKGVRIVQEPYDEVFGRTFVAADPDGNLIRVSPMDWEIARLEIAESRGIGENFADVPGFFCCSSGKLPSSRSRGACLA